jgi:hypothetical protein
VFPKTLLLTNIRLPLSSSYDPDYTLNRIVAASPSASTSTFERVWASSLTTTSIQHDRKRAEAIGHGEVVPHPPVCGLSADI